jgi:hypothetical protein
LLEQTCGAFVELALIVMGILWFTCVRRWCKSAIANERESVNVPARRFFLAVFGERQLEADNLHAAEKLFERHDQGCPIDLRSARHDFFCTFRTIEAKRGAEKSNHLA